MKPSNLGGVRELPSGRFQARYRPRNAKHISHTFSSPEEAWEWLAAIEEAVTNERKLEAEDKARRYGQ